MRHLLAMVCASLGMTAIQAQTPTEPAPTVGPSFDCRAAATYAERTICGDPMLRALDLGLARFYESSSGNRGGDFVVREQRRWLRTQRNACRTAQCLHEALLDRLWEMAIHSGPDMPIHWNEDAEGMMLIVPLGSDWYAFGAIGYWRGPTINTAGASGAVRLVNGRGEIAGAAADACSYTLVRLAESRWQLIARPPRPDASCGGLNATVEGTYELRR